MLLSTTIGTLMKTCEYTDVINMAKNAGFDALDFSFNVDRKYVSTEFTDDWHKKTFTEFRKIAEDKGLVFNQAHAPYPSSVSEEKRTEEIFNEIVISIKNASYLGAKCIVVHPCQHLKYDEEEVPEKLFEMNMEFYNRLKPYAEEYDVKIAIENMWQNIGKKITHSTCSKPEEFIKYIDTLNSKHFVACLDIGHAELVTEDLYNFIKMLGKDRLKALHVHDVDGINDSHTIPYYGIVRWDKVTKALKEIQYDGDFTYETSYVFTSSRPVALYQSTLNHLAETGKHLINQIKS
ncbi:MAG: sugar phosphate isomerase/epimerase [Ruminococcaceae bacterium]|nr:sugar phosphate isomerase/epimerase [Oscillospiraceae bacterium]